MDSKRQIMRKDAPMNRPTKHQGAQAPEASIHVTTDFRGGRLKRERGEMGMEIS
jgi:hypothetical protein